MAEEAEELPPSEVPEESEFDSAFEEFANKDQDEPSEDTPELDGEELAAAAAAEDADPYEGMSEDVKARFIAMEGERDNLTHRVQSDAGRVSALQRKVNGLEEEIQDIRSGPTSGGQPSETEIKDAMMGSDEEWEQFAQDYPQVAKAIDSRFEASATALQKTVDSTLTPIKRTIAKIDSDGETSANQQRVDAVSEVFPEWTTEVAKPEFKLWLDDQPPGVAQLSGSADPRDAVALIGMYDEFLVADGKPSLRKETDPTEPGVEDVTGESEPSELEKRRAKQKAAGATIPSKPAGIDATGEAASEFDTAFAHFARKREGSRQTA